MYIIAVRCLSTSITYCSRAFLFFPSFTFSPSSLSSPFFPSYLFPPSLLVRFPTSLPFHSTLLSFLTPPFIPTSLFPPISFSIIFPFFLFDPSFPCCPPSRPTPYFFPIPPLIQPLLFSIHSLFLTPPFLPTALFHPIPPFHPTPSFLPIPPFFPTPPLIPSPLSIIPLFSFLSLLLYLPFFSSYPSFPFCHLPFPCLISILPLLSHHSFPSYPSILSYPISIPSYLSFTCLPPSLRLPLLFVTSAFILTPASLPLLLSLPHSLSSLPPSPFHSPSLIISFAFLSPPSFALLHSLSPC